MSSNATKDIYKFHKIVIWFFIVVIRHNSPNLILELVFQKQDYFVLLYNISTILNTRIKNSLALPMTYKVILNNLYSLLMLNLLYFCWNILLLKDGERSKSVLVLSFFYLFIFFILEDVSIVRICLIFLFSLCDARWRAPEIVQFNNFP